MKPMRCLSCTTVILAAIAVFGQHASYQPTNEEKAQMELVAQLKSQRIDYLSFWERAFKTGILFYGQVVDQDGAPVEGAQVTYSASSDLRMFDGRSDKHRLTSGRGGVFTIKTNGTDMFVSVEKEGYRPVEVLRPDAGRGVQAGERVGSGVRVQYFDMSGKPDRNHHPSEKRPVQFAIRKIGKLENLKQVSGRFKVMRPDGTPRSISLDQNRTDAHCIEIICNSEYVGPVDSLSTTVRYGWSFEIKVDKGGVCELKDEGFEAPAEGYSASLTVCAMNVDDKRWDDRFYGKAYYVRFEDGVCAKLKIPQGGVAVNGRHEPYVIITSWLNPDSKSRNLETKPGE